MALGRRRARCAEQDLAGLDGERARGRAKAGAPPVRSPATATCPPHRAPRDHRCLRRLATLPGPQGSRHAHRDRAIGTGLRRSARRLKWWSGAKVRSTTWSGPLPRPMMSGALARDDGQAAALARFVAVGAGVVALVSEQRFGPSAGSAGARRVECRRDQGEGLGDVVDSGRGRDASSEGRRERIPQGHRPGELRHGHERAVSRQIRLLRLVTVLLVVGQQPGTTASEPSGQHLLQQVSPAVPIASPCHHPSHPRSRYISM